MAFLGTVDPDGWVICDGGKNIDGTNKPARSNADGRYNNLIANGIGTGVTNSGNYTPPDYRGAFLRGAGTDPTNVYSGPNIKTLQTHATQTHTHSASQDSHYHRNASYTMFGGGGFTRAIRAEIGDIQSLRTDYTSDLFITDSQTPKITVADSSTVGTTLTDVNETRPYNYGVNWIIKL